MDGQRIQAGDYVTLHDGYAEAWRGGHVVRVKPIISREAATYGQPSTLLRIGFGAREDGPFLWRYGSDIWTPTSDVRLVERRDKRGNWQPV